MLEQTLWGALDYLVIDMPPGTGDIQLTLSQKAKGGGCGDCDDQDIALMDARRHRDVPKVDIPILGVVENMAVHICSNCGHREHIFGAGAGSASPRNTVWRWAACPGRVHPRTDRFRPANGLADPDSPVTAVYLEIATAVQAALAAGGAGAVHKFPQHFHLRRLRR